jgi:hypothetical protein
MNFFGGQTVLIYAHKSVEFKQGAGCAIATPKATVALAEYVLLAGGQVQTAGQSGGHVLKFERLFMPMKRFRAPLVLVSYNTDLNQRARDAL